MDPWDRWDEELPPWNNKYWTWAIDADSPVLGEETPIGISLNNNRVLFASSLCYGTRSKAKASVLFYSLDTTQVQIFNNKYKIPQPNWAVVAFPSEKSRMIVMVYKIEKNKSVFFKKWEIGFNNYETIVPKESEFRDMFKTWLQTIFTVENFHMSMDEIVDSLLPKLLIFDRSNFIILLGTVQEIEEIEGIIKIRSK